MSVLIVGGSSVVRDDDWRSQVDLATADRSTVYRCGLEDGYHLAIAELRDVARLMVDHLAAAGWSA